MQVDTTNRIIGFEEKNPNPKTIPGDPQHCLASMGIYVFNARFLFEQLCLDATQPGSQHDFGRNIIPSVIDSHRVLAFPFRDENRKQDAYWRDVGTLDAYFEANMDLVTVDPLLNMYDMEWPIRTYQPNFPPPKFVFAEEGHEARRGEAVDSVVCSGSIVSGGHVRRSILGPNVRDQQLRPRRGIDSVRRGRHRPACSRAAGDHRQRSAHSARGVHWLRSGARSRPRLYGNRKGRHGNCQGRRGGALSRDGGDRLSGTPRPILGPPAVKPRPAMFADRIGRADFAEYIGHPLRRKPIDLECRGNIGRVKWLRQWSVNKLSKIARGRNSHAYREPPATAHLR